MEQYTQMKSELEASVKRIKELQDDNSMMKIQLEQLTLTVSNFYCLLNTQLSNRTVLSIKLNNASKN